MKYNKIKNAKFIDRPNRFIANVLIDGIKEKVHVRNTGRCKELFLPGSDLILEDCKDNPNRKTRYSVVSVYKKNNLINVDSQIPNLVVFNALENNEIKELKNPLKLKREVTYKDSRFDIAFEKNGIMTFLEVKGVTLEDNGLAMFPDAPTTRGTKHVYHMIDAVKNGYQGVIFFLIQMKGPKLFKLHWQRDRDFAEAVNLAKKKGVTILAYDSLVTENGIELGEKINIDLSE